MPTLANGYHSYFSVPEGAKIMASTSKEILGLMHAYPSLNLRFIHDLAARNLSQLALDVVNESDPIVKPTYVDELIATIPKEFGYYRETKLPSDQYAYHAFTIPYILLLSQGGFVSVHPNDNADNLFNFVKVSELALERQMQLMEALS